MAQPGTQKTAHIRPIRLAAAGVIALHAKRGYRVVSVCRSSGKSGIEYAEAYHCVFPGVMDHFA